MTTRRKLLEKEVQILKEKYTGQDKCKLNNEIMNSTSHKHYENIYASLSENNRKILSLQNKIDELIYEMNKYGNMLSLENFDKNNTDNFNQDLDKKLFATKECLIRIENKLIAIKREIENVKEFVQEAIGEREELNIKIQKLIEIFIAINQANNKINAILNFILESFENRDKFLESEAEFFKRYTESRNIILVLIKEINSYKDKFQYHY